MYSNDVKLITIIKKYSFKKYFTYSIQKFVELNINISQFSIIK